MKLVPIIRQVGVAYMGKENHGKLGNIAMVHKDIYTTQTPIN